MEVVHIKTHAILVNTSSLQIKANNPNELINCLYKYADIILQPYNSIGVFSYKELNTDNPPIIGHLSPLELIESLKYYSNKVYEEYSNALSGKYLSVTPSTRFLSRDAKELKALQIISGIYLYESCFFNCYTKSSIITENEWAQITENVNDYALIFLNMYL